MESSHHHIQNSNHPYLIVNERVTSFKNKPKRLKTFIRHANGRMIDAKQAKRGAKHRDIGVKQGYIGATLLLIGVKYCLLGFNFKKLAPMLARLAPIIDILAPGF